MNWRADGRRTQSTQSLQFNSVSLLLLFFFFFVLLSYSVVVACFRQLWICDAPPPILCHKFKFHRWNQFGANVSVFDWNFSLATTHGMNWNWNRPKWRKKKLERKWKLNGTRHATLWFSGWSTNFHFYWMNERFVATFAISSMRLSEAFEREREQLEREKIARKVATLSLTWKIC